MDKTRNLRWDQSRGQYVKTRQPAKRMDVEVEPRISRDVEGIQASECGLCGKICDEPNPVDFYVPGTNKLICRDCMPYADDMAKVFLLMHPEVTDEEVKKVFPNLERSAEFEAALTEVRREGGNEARRRR